MQARQRVVGDGAGGVRLEHYSKPRVTTNASYGGADGVNAGVPPQEHTVVLPRVQQLARALAIIDGAGADGAEGGARPRAVAWVADAESAYRFCPVQRADWWTQCFIWWDEHGRAGVIVDQRMSFGGAFAPNRFERISTLVAAWVRRKHAEFDAAQPPPEAVRQWMQRRSELQRAGDLPPGGQHVVPRYIQVYIDDFSGVSMDDVVQPPAEIALIAIDPTHTMLAGGAPAPPCTRAHVHARLAVLGLAELGLHAAPAKVVVGDPVVALGMSLGREEGRLRCPDGKRELLMAALAELRSELRQAAR
eukprot:6193319-Pleurochrysis_carterae.AAC.1